MLRKICFRVLLCVVGLLFATVATVQAADAPDTQNTGSKKDQPIPWDQIGAKAGADYHGDGLCVAATEAGARLHCVFQRMDGEATAEGLWLTSTDTNAMSDRFRVKAVEVGTSRLLAIHRSCDVPARVPAGGTRLEPTRSREFVPSPNAALPPSLRSYGATSGDGDGAARHPYLGVLPRTGTVTVDGQTVRFIRPGLTEEYSVSMDGVRQDFEVQSADCKVQNGAAGGLVLTLAVSGARVKATAYGAQLVLEKSGRRIAYSRLRATDATGKELPARIEIPPGESGTELAIVVSDAGAVYPVRIDPTFSDANWIGLDSENGTDGTVSAAVTDGTGNLYIGGSFAVAGDVIVNNIAKWNGSSWSALGSGMGGGDFNGPQVYALALSGGTLYAGGDFTTAGGIAATNIAEWNGSSWSALGSGLNGNVNALAVSGATLYAGGQFVTAGGTAATNIAQWNGSSWSPLGTGIGARLNYVKAVAVSGSTVYVGGQFVTAGGNAASNIAQWNGNSWSPLGSGIVNDLYSYNEGYVSALAVSGGTLYAGGNFTTAGGTNANYIAQWDGSNWSPLGPGPNGYVNALAVSGGTLYASGAFSFFAGGHVAIAIAQWNGSGWLPMGSGMSNAVNVLAVSGGTLYAGGAFKIAGGTNANFIAQWNGSNWSPLGSGFGGFPSSFVNALAVSGGTLYAGGNFTTAGRTNANNIAQWTGSGWSPLGSGMNNTVTALAVSGGTLYAGGNFIRAGGTNANLIAQWNGTSWSPLGSGIVEEYAYSYVYALAVSGGTLYAGGNFTAAGGTNANYVAQWNGTNWAPLGSGLNNSVYALAVSGGTLYAGGGFSTAGSTNANHIAQWNGNSWSPLGSGLNSNVFALAVSSSNLYAGGGFSKAGGTNAYFVARWDGGSWSPLGSGMDSVVYALAVSGGTLYAGGIFTKADGTNANRIAQWDGSTWSPLGSGINHQANALALSGDTLYAGGSFTTAGGKVSAYVAEAYLIAPPGGIADSIVTPSSGIANVKFYGNPGQQFGVQRSMNLSPPGWTTVNTGPLSPAADGSFTFVDTNAPIPAAYYRSFQY